MPARILPRPKRYARVRSAFKLAGDASYFGKFVHKPTIGDALRELEPEDICRANRLMVATVILTLLFCLAVRFSVCLMARGGF